MTRSLIKEGPRPTGNESSTNRARSTVVRRLACVTPIFDRVACLF
jgi:hypothetical protein